LFDGFVQDSKSLGKPFILEEFGKIVNKEDGIDLRDNFYKAAYEIAEEYAKNDGIFCRAHCSGIGVYLLSTCLSGFIYSPKTSSFAFKMVGGKQLSDDASSQKRKPNFACE
jgi:hypothetical protein